MLYALITNLPVPTYGVYGMVWKIQWFEMVEGRDISGYKDKISGNYFRLYQ